MLSIHVQLERFEGPLGLLLHLIREQEMDIFNINIHHITRQYLEYIKTMRRLDLEVAGEFVAMAATLLHIKSRMLLPQYDEQGEEIKEDPRKELVQKLLEYKKMRELSADLYKLPLLGRDVFPRGTVEDVEALEEGELVLEENPLFSLIAAYRTALRNMKKTVHRVIGELQSIATRILEIREYLVVGKRVLFNELITETSEHRSNQVLVTFLSLLELAKMGFISVFQNDAFADIHIEAKQAIDRDVVSQVENYESVNAEQTAEKIMAESAQLELTEPEAMLEGEEAPVVQESFADAATDAEIDAELAAIAAEDQALGAIPFQALQEMPGEFIEPTVETPVEAAMDDAAAISAMEIETVMEAAPELAAEAADVVHPEPESETESVVDRNVNSAVSAAVSAFDAFKDDDERPPEVEP
jgi:segregation and condensation protein A